MFKLKMHKAGNGDCISIHTQSDVVLIDGGTAQSFDIWKTDIIGCVERIDSLIITHIDNDHVNGIIKLLEDEDCPDIGQIYFNGAEQLFGELDNSSAVDSRADRKLQALAEECSAVTDKEKIGYSEGTSLSYVIANNDLKCNEIVNGEALYREKLESFDVGAIKFTMIGPDKNTLNELKAVWADKLNEKRIKPKIISKSYYDAFEQYANNIQNLISNNHQISAQLSNSIESLAKIKFQDDDSLTNKSSFSFLIESEGKKILYLGDCHAKTVISWLDHIKLDKIKVNAVKISHHGSMNNTSLDLLKRIDCQKYLISTNGKSHSHPDLETLARIAFVNKSNKTDIYMNYDLDSIPEWFSTELSTDYSNITLSMDSYEVTL